MAEKIVVVGLGLLGAALVSELATQGYDVLGIDRRSERVKEVSNNGVSVVQGDATSKGMWDDLGLADYAAAVIAFSSNVEASILTVFNIRKIGIPHIIAKSNGEHHTEVLRAIGVNVVVQPDEEMGKRLAHTIGSHLADYVSLTEDFGAAKILVSQALEGRTCGGLESSARTSVLLIR